MNVQKRNNGCGGRRNSAPEPMGTARNTALEISMPYKSGGMTRCQGAEMVH